MKNQFKGTISTEMIKTIDKTRINICYLHQVLSVQPLLRGGLQGRQGFCDEWQCQKKFLSCGIHRCHILILDSDSVEFICEKYIMKYLSKILEL